MTIQVSHTSRCFVGLAAALLLTLGGCTDDWETRRPGRAVAVAGGENIAEAVNYLPLLMRLDRTNAVKEIIYQLNGWSAGLQDSQLPAVTSAWQTYAPEVQPLMRPEQLRSKNFAEPECEYLLQCQLMKRLSDWVLGTEYHDPLFTPWLASLPEDTAKADLTKVMKLFDWTARNVALLPATASPADLLPEPTLPLDDQAPVYSQLPWQTLMIGRGDAWQRARVFTQLLQQINRPAVVLTVGSGEGRELWCVGVPIGGELYLFEPKWGLPIIGPDEKGVATWRQIQADRNILRRANLPGQFDYPVEFDDLSQVRFELDVEPYAIRSVMRPLQERLVGEDRMIVYVDADRWLDDVRQVTGTEVTLWEIPVLATAYNESVRQRLFDQSPFSMNYLAYYGPYLSDTLINSARQKHLRGSLKDTDDQVGALKDYMSIRVDDETLDKLPINAEIQTRLGLKRGINESFEEFIARASQVASFYKTAKYQSSTYLAMAQFDQGNFGAAEDWLRNRTLKIDESVAWHPHAEYLLARVLEVKGEPTEAMDWLRREGRPQEFGNRIRARLIQQRLQP